MYVNVCKYVSMCACASVRAEGSMKTNDFELELTLSGVGICLLIGRAAGGAAGYGPPGSYEWVHTNGFIRMGSYEWVRTTVFNLVNNFLILFAEESLQD